MRSDTELICRYLKIKSEPDARIVSQIESICGAMEESLVPGKVFRVFPLFHDADGIRLGKGGPALTGNSADRLLNGCQSAAILTLTLGFDFERMLTAVQKRDMAEAVILDACASAYLEFIADEAEKEIRAATGGYLTDRFSPGYGDMPLSLQTEFIRLTDAEKRLGVHVLDSFLLNPVKSMTAIIGIANTPRPAIIKGCMHCSLNDTCAYKKGDGYCEDR